MRSISTQGIVLRSQEQAEADRLVIIYSRELGKIRAIARGVRKTSSRRANLVQIFSHGQFMLYRRSKAARQFTLTRAVGIEGFEGLRGDLEKLSLGAVILEATEACTLEQDPQPELFDTLLLALRALEDFQRGKEVLVAFLFRLLVITGLAPDVNSCQRCRAPAGTEDNYFSPGEGGLVCDKCRQPGEHLHSLSAGSLAFLRRLRTLPVEHLRRLCLSDAQFEESFSSLLALCEYHFDWSSRAALFLRQGLQ